MRCNLGNVQRPDERPTMLAMVDLPAGISGVRTKTTGKCRR